MQIRESGWIFVFFCASSTDKLGLVPPDARNRKLRLWWSWGVLTRWGCVPSFLWPWDSALQECSSLTSLTGGPSPGGAVKRRNNNLFVPHRGHQPGRWERLKSDEGRERSKGRTEEFGKKLQHVKPWLSPLPFVFVSIGWIFSTLLLVHWAMVFCFSLSPAVSNAECFELAPQSVLTHTCHLSA